MPYFTATKFQSDNFSTKQDQRPALAHNAASDKVIQLADDDKDFNLQEKKALLAVENKARIDFQPKSLDCENVLICSFVSLQKYDE